MHEIDPDSSGFPDWDVPEAHGFVSEWGVWESEKSCLCVFHGDEEVNVLLEVRLLNIREHRSDIL
jgi:hypothetical protein